MHLKAAIMRKPLMRCLVAGPSIHVLLSDSQLERYHSPIGEAKMAGLPALNLAISVLKLRVHGVSGSNLSPETQYPQLFFSGRGVGGAVEVGGFLSLSRQIPAIDIC